jgi:translation initiation factor 4A
MSENNDDNLKIWTKKYKNFDDMNLPTDLLKGIYCYGFDKPSAIQQRAIVALATGNDLIAQSQSGTGKTGAFSIGMLSRMKTNYKGLQGIVLSPTRELAQQTYDVLKNLAQNMNLKIEEFIGGTDVSEDLKKIQEGVQIAVGTPGRLYDLIERGYLKTNSVSIFVIDEADQMLSNDFKEQVRKIMTKIPQDCQMTIFSATLTNEVINISKHIMNEPYHILLQTHELTLEGITQYYVDVNQESWKFDVLLDLYKSINITCAIIYINSMKKCDYVYDKLISENFSVSKIHGKMEQTKRNEIMREFRTGKTRVLLTTDLLARGIDVQSVSLVINYDLPKDKENYIHRIGRTGRFGRKGNAINFVVPEEVDYLHDLEKFYSTNINCLPQNLDIIIT